MDKHWWPLINSTIYGASSAPLVMFCCMESIWDMKEDHIVRRITMKDMELSALTAKDLSLARFFRQVTTITFILLVLDAVNVETHLGMGRRCIFKGQQSGILDVDLDLGKADLSSMDLTLQALLMDLMACPQQ
jgi:hypothetical protein